MAHKKKSEGPKGQKGGQVPEDFITAFNTLTEEAQDSFYILDKSGRFLYLNKKALEKMGHGDDPSKIIGVDFRDVIHGDDLQRTVDNFVRRLKDEFIPPYDTRVKDGSGRYIDVEISSTPIFSKGEIVGEWGIARDVTERRRMEAEIKERYSVLEQEVEAKTRQAQVYERNIEIFMRNSNDAIVIVDPDRNISSWNRGAELIYGYKAEEVIGRPISLTIPKELRIEFEEVLHEVERRGHIRNFETERVRKDGNRITIQSTINVIRNKDGALLGFAGITRDITEQKKLQKDLIRSKLDLEQAYEKLKQHNIYLEDSVRMLESTLKVKPVKELGALEDGDAGFVLEPRRCYLIKDSDPVTAFRIFTKLVLSKGMHGLIITRTLPSRIRKKYNLHKTPIVWLTTNRIAGETCVSPSGIAELSGVIVSFLDQTKNGMVLIEGLEYLVTQNNFRSILNLIQLINDKIMISDSRMMVTLDPRTLDEKEVHLIQKEAVEFIETEAPTEPAKRYQHLLDRFKYEPERGERG